MSGVLLPLCVPSLSLDLCCVDADVGRGEGERRGGRHPETVCAVIRDTLGDGPVGAGFRLQDEPVQH